MTVSAAAVCLMRRNSRNLAIFLGILALCAISFLPYLDAYTSGNNWSIVAESPVTFRLLWKEFILALGNPNPAFAVFWAISLVILVTSGCWSILRLRLI